MAVKDMSRAQAIGAGVVAVLLVAALGVVVNQGAGTEQALTAAGQPFRSPAGVWVIHQLTSASQVTTQTTTALATPGVVGYGPRIPINMILSATCTVSTTVLDTQRSVSLARGKLFKPRVIWGKYTPACAKGTPISGFNGPAPYLPGGAPNTAFESAYHAVLQAEATWAADKPDVVEFDCGWYSLNYSELYNGPEMQTLYGQSKAKAEANFIASHKRLIDIAYSVGSTVGVPVGFGLSGHGPIGNIAKELGAYLASKPMGTTYGQANGFAPEGEWGGALEATHDQNIWVALKGKMAAGLQDISPPSGRSTAEVTKMWDNVRTLQAQGVLIVYVEQYDYQWDNGGGRFHDDVAAYNEFKKQIGLFRSAALPGAPPSVTVTPTPTTSPPTTPPPSSPTPNPELEALKAQLVALQDQLVTLAQNVATATQVLSEASAALAQAQSDYVAAQAALAAAQQAQVDALTQISIIQARIVELESSPTPPPPSPTPTTPPPPTPSVPPSPSSCAPSCPVATATITVNVPNVGDRTVTVKYPNVAGTAPLIVAGHGSALTGVDSANQNAFLATAGYVLAAPTFGNIVSNIPQGATVVTAVITAIDNLTTGPLANKVDASQGVGYIGTSMGGMIGYALMRPATDDPRIKAFVIRAGQSSGSEALVAGPALLAMHGTADATISINSGQAAYNRASSPKAFITLAGATHSLAVAGPLFTAGPIGFFDNFIRGDPLGLTKLNAAVAATPTATMVTAW